MSHAATHSADHAHGHGGQDSHGDHGHHMIVPRRLLLTVLGILMFFTLVTVGAAQLEQAIAHQFDIVIPQWVNVAVALSIAAVKTLFVMAIFMQLRWDNPFNSLIMVFTVFTLCFFLGFIMIDLGNRDSIYPYKSKYVVEGGSGNITVAGGSVPAGTSIAMQARVWAMEKADNILIKEKGTLPKYLVVFCSQEIERQLAAKKTEAEFPPVLKEFMKVRNQAPYAEILAAASHGHGKGHSADGSSANRSRTRSGLTDPELGGKPAEGHGHGGAAGHAEKPGAAGEPKAGEHK